MAVNYADEISFDDFEYYDDEVYFHELEWNREIIIKIFINKEYLNDKNYINKISKVITKVRKEEIELYNRGINYLIKKNFLDLDEEDKERFEEEKDIFLSTDPDNSEVFINMDSNGAGSITYTVFMYGGFNIEFDKDGNFEKASSNTH